MARGESVKNCAQTRFVRRRRWLDVPERDHNLSPIRLQTRGRGLGHGLDPHQEADAGEWRRP